MTIPSGPYSRPGKFCAVKTAVLSRESELLDERAAINAQLEAIDAKIASVDQAKSKLVTFEEITEFTGEGQQLLADAVSLISEAP